MGGEPEWFRGRCGVEILDGLGGCGAHREERPLGVLERENRIGVPGGNGFLERPWKHQVFLGTWVWAEVGASGMSELVLRTG